MARVRQLCDLPVRFRRIGLEQLDDQPILVLDCEMTAVDVGADDVGPWVNRLVEHDDLVAGEKIARRDARRADFHRAAASGFAPDSKAAKNIRAAGYPPDLITTQGDPPTSLWRVHYLQFWEITMCQWQKRLDPAYDTYGAGLGNYVYVNRLSLSNVGESLVDFRTTGRIRRPLITVAGTMDALLPIDANARAYARRVAAVAREEAHKASPAYRLYEVQNGNHIETFKVTFPQLEFIQPHALQAFDLLVGAIENQAELPPRAAAQSPRTPHSRAIVRTCWPHDGCSDCRGYPGFARPT
jgi:hypothetical protein